MTRRFVDAGWLACCLALHLFSGAPAAAEATEKPTWIGEADGFKVTRFCDGSDLEIVSPPYSSENDVVAGDMCGKVYVFNDSDSDERIAFAGAFIFDPVIAVQEYTAARRQLIEMLMRDGGGESLRLEFGDISSEISHGFSFERIRTRSNGVEGPAGSMSWDVGIREVGQQTVMIYSGLTDLAEQTDILSAEEKASAAQLLMEFSRWKTESLGRLATTADAP